MARRLRIEIADGLYHVTNRRLGRRDIVRDDLDRTEWLRLLGRIATRYRWRVFACVLLDNHFHIYLRTPEPNLSAGMHDLESGYASQFNRRHDRRGPLFQGRFHAVLVEDDSHSWEISRYVHLNSTRAGVAAHPANYRWSSYGAYLDAKKAPKWVDWRTVLAEFAGTEGAARIAYRRFVDAGLNGGAPNPLAQAVEGWILGSDNFVERCRLLAATAPAERPTMEQVLEAVAAEFETPVEIVRFGRQHGNRARQAAMLLVRELCSESLAEVAECFGLSPSGVTEGVRRTPAFAERMPAYHEVLERLRAKLG